MATANTSPIVQLRDGGLAPVARASLTSKTYMSIRTALMSSHFKAGERLVLCQLAAELGISPTPVREALLRLASEHALAIDARGVACVPAFDPEQYIEVRDLRIDLEGQAAAVACGRATEAAVDQLERLHGEFIQAEVLHDTRAAFAANERFHMRLYALAERPVLLSLIESLWVRCGPLFVRLHDRDIVLDANRHDVIIRGMRERDPEMVRRGVAEDIMTGWKYLIAVDD